MKTIKNKIKDKFDYYKAPSDEIFNDIKSNAIKIWESYDNEFGYSDEKLYSVREIRNIRDNVWTIVGMFDYINQMKLIGMVKPATAHYLAHILNNNHNI